MIFSLFITLTVLAITGFMFWKVFLPMIQNANKLMSSMAQDAADRQSLLASGQPGQARVLGVQSTGVMVNYNPQVVLDLEVHPASGSAPFLARCTSVVAQLAIPRVQPGATLPVRFDPHNTARVAVCL